MNMVPSVFDKRPPFVRFEHREYGLNEQASLDAGRPIPHVVAMACITPFASKDVIEKPAEEWLQQIRLKASRGEYPAEWARTFREQYEAWKDGNELPRDGTPIQTWQLGTAEQRVRLKALGYTTVEDLAMVPDSGLGQIGLDGRALRDQARAWIDEAKDKGINAKALSDANVRIEQLEQENGQLRKTVETLVGRLDALEAGEAPPAKRGRTAAA